MKNRISFTLLTFLITLTFTTISYSQDYTTWELPEGAKARLGKGHVSSVQYSPDGTRLAVAGNIGIWLYDAQTGEELNLYTRHADWVSSVAFSPDGNTIASGSRDNTVHLWHTNTGEHIRTLSGHPNNVYTVAFSPDGNTIASGGTDNIIRLWNAKTGEHIKTLSTHMGDVESVAFSPDGTKIASGGRDDTIRLWNANTGEHSKTLTGHTTSVSSVAFSPDGNTIASGSYDGTVLLWELLPTSTSNSTVSLSPASVVSPDVGQQLTFSVNIAGGQKIAGYQAIVSYDTTALQYVESENGDYLPEGAFAIPPIAEGDNVILAASAINAEATGDGTLATITFEVISVKASTMTLADVILTNMIGNATLPQFEHAEITEPKRLPEDVNDDGIVNIIDLTLVASNFGKSGENDADINADGIVNIIDLTLVAAAFGKTTIDAAPTLWRDNPDSVLTRAAVEKWLQAARQRNLSDPDFQRGILVLESLLKTLTPKETALLPNYPNPFNPETWIPYQLSTAAEVSISIYAADGTFIRRLDLGHKPVGIYRHRLAAAYWDGKNAAGEPVASGVYFYTLTAGEFTATRKMLIRK